MRQQSGELDPALVEEAKKGRARACRALVQRYERPVTALLRRVLGPSGLGSLTEDLAQETFVRALAALPRFELAGRAKLSTWLLRIATRLALHELERQRLKTESLEDRHHAVAGAWATDAGTRHAALGRAIEQAVGKLVPGYRAAFILREYHDLDYTTIAETLGIDVGTVKSRLHRARAQLRQALKEFRE